MTEKLAAIVLGNRDSGKSTTWNVLFQRTVKTGTYQRELVFNACESALVFLVSGSPQERQTYIDKIIADEDPSIVLSSLQYVDAVLESFQYFRDNGYQLYVHWINPGYNDGATQEDVLSIVPTLLEWGATITVVNGRASAEQRVREMRNFVYGWAKPRGLVTENSKWA